MKRSAWLVVVVATLPAACSGGSHAAAARGHGCGSRAAPGTTTLTQTSGGLPRSTVVHVPTRYTGSHAVPLVLNLHGSQGTSAKQEALTGMNATADTNTFIVAYPQAVIPSGPGFEWNVPGAALVGGPRVPAGAADDESFLEQVVSTLRTQYCVDAKRVYATGFSGGARLASQLGCDESTTFAAIAPVGGLRFPAPCNASRLVPVISFHGRVDPIAPYNGHGRPYWTYSVPTAAQRWAAHDGCSLVPAASQPHADAARTAYRGCHGGAAVELYTLARAGHIWPGGPKLPRAVTRLVGPQTDAADADGLIWRFFAAHPLP